MHGSNIYAVALLRVARAAASCPETRGLCEHVIMNVRENYKMTPIATASHTKVYIASVGRHSSREERRECLRSSLAIAAALGSPSPLSPAKQENGHQHRFRAERAARPRDLGFSDRSGADRHLQGQAQGGRRRRRRRRRCGDRKKAQEPQGAYRAPLEATRTDTVSRL